MLHSLAVRFTAQTQHSQVVRFIRVCLDVSLLALFATCVAHLGECSSLMDCSAHCDTHGCTLASLDGLAAAVGLASIGALLQLHGGQWVQAALGVGAHLGDRKGSTTINSLVDAAEAASRRDARRAQLKQMMLALEQELGEREVWPSHTSFRKELAKLREMQRELDSLAMAQQQQRQQQGSVGTAASKPPPPSPSQLALHKGRSVALGSSSKPTATCPRTARVVALGDAADATLAASFDKRDLQAALAQAGLPSSSRTASSTLHVHRASRVPTCGCA